MEMERSTLKRSGSSPDLGSAKAMRSSLIDRPISGSPLLMLSLEEDGCRLYNPDDDRVYETKSDLSGYRFLANSGKWFLVVDSGLKLSIIDVFSDERIDLPALESINGGLFKFERVGENIVRGIFTRNIGFACWTSHTAEDLSGLLWVDHKNGDYVVVWEFKQHDLIAFCKKDDDHYREITTQTDVPRLLQGLKDMRLVGYSLYVLATRYYIRRLDLSGKDGFKDVSENHRFPMCRPGLSMEETELRRQNKITSFNNSIAVTRSGEVLFVYTYEYESSVARHRKFHLYKRDPKDLDPKTYDTRLLEVDSLGDEALFLDFGTTVPANRTLGIEPNSIYFTRSYRIGHEKPSSLDICVFDLTTKDTKPFTRLSNLNLKDAQWFIPS